MDQETFQDAVSGLFAYDTGSISSGIKDDLLKIRVGVKLKSMNRLEISRLCRDMFISEEMLLNGYGIEDLISFTNWMHEEFGICYG